MLDQLVSLIRENAGQVIENDPNVPAAKTEEVVQLAQNSVTSGLQSMLAQGRVNDLLKMFSGRGDIAQSPAAQQVSGSFVEQLTSQLGLSGAQAGGLASSLIPTILGSLVNRTNDPGDKNFNIQDIFNQLSGGKTSGLNVGGLLDKFKSGLDTDGDGDVDLQDLQNLLAGGGSGGGVGGLLDQVKGMFK